MRTDEHFEALLPKVGFLVRRVRLDELVAAERLANQREVVLEDVLVKSLPAKCVEMKKAPEEIMHLLNDILESPNNRTNDRLTRSKTM